MAAGGDGLRPEQPDGLEQAPHLERGLVGRGHQHDVGPHHVADHPSEVGIVGAAQQQGVDAGRRAGASSRSASTVTCSPSVSPRSTNSTKPGQAAR